MDHEWPEDQEEHKWGPWMPMKGLPKPMQYRKCVHPDCHEVQERPWPQS